MIDEAKLLEWCETHKTLSKTYSSGTDGKFYYAIPWVDLRGEIQRLRGGEVIDDKTEAAEDP